MSILNSDPAPVKAASSPASQTSGSPLTSDDERRLDILRRSPFNRDMIELRKMLHALRDKLEVFTEHDGDKLCEMWAAAGVDPDVDDDFSQSYLVMADEVPQDACGFLWAVNSFLGVIEANVSARDDEWEEDGEPRAVVATAGQPTA